MPAKTSKLARVTEALALQHKGATNAAIAEQMGLSLSTVKRLLASDVAREVVAKTAEEARKTLSASADAAAHVLVDIATDEDAKDADRINACKSILDRTGVVPGKEVKHTTDWDAHSEGELRDRAKTLLDELEAADEEP